MSGRGKGRQATNTGKGQKTYGAKTSTPTTIMAADVRAMQPSVAGLPGGGTPQLIAQLLQSLTHPGAPSTAGGHTDVRMTQREYSEYVADCAARRKREETEKEVKLAEAIAAGVKAGLAAQGLPATTNVDGQRKKAKTKKQKATAIMAADADEGSSKTPYECVMAKLGLPASTVKTVTTVAKKQTKQTATPQTRLVNLAKSFEGAAEEIDQEAYPFPNPTKQETEALQHITATIIGMMGKCDATGGHQGRQLHGLCHRL